MKAVTVVFSLISVAEMSRQTSGGKTEDKDTRVDRNSLCNESSGIV